MGCAPSVDLGQVYVMWKTMNVSLVDIVFTAGPSRGGTTPIVLQLWICSLGASLASGSLALRNGSCIRETNHCTPLHILDLWYLFGDNG